MSSVLADFTGRFTADSEHFDGPTQGRILLGTDQLVLAASDETQLQIPLSAVVDVNIDSVPQVFDPLPGMPVTIGFNQHGSHNVALIATDADTIEKFIPVLFRAVLSGTRVTIKHPAKLGGRVLDTAFRGGVLSISSNAVRVETEDGPVTIGLETVIDYSRERRTIDGEQRSAVIVDHMNNGEALTTITAIDSSRKLSLLGRFLQREYENRMASLADISLSEIETEVLTTIYSTGEHDISLANVLGVEPNRVKQILHTLHGKGLIESRNDQPVLTPDGQIIVNQYLERVNA